MKWWQSFLIFQGFMIMSNQAKAANEMYLPELVGAIGAIICAAYLLYEETFK